MTIFKKGEETEEIQSKEIKEEKEVGPVSEPIIVTKGQDKEFELIPPGTHLAVCVGIHDLGKQESTFGVNRKILVRWELDVKRTEGDLAGQNFVKSNFYTSSLHKKANLRRDVESWLGRGLSDAEVEGYDVTVLKGQGCLISIIHKPNKAGDIKDVVSGVMSLPKGTEALKSTVPDVDQTPEWVEKIQEKQVE